MPRTVQGGGAIPLLLKEERLPRIFARIAPLNLLVHRFIERGTYVLTVTGIAV
jgi:hypothetical protein